jgi:hypothetical protein
MGMTDAEVVDYPRMAYEARAHHERYLRRVEADGLLCQECGGTGRIGYDSVYNGPAEPCGFCESTGKVTRYMRGVWLAWRRQFKRAALSGERKE